jgi:hypothetical protein
MMTGTGPYGAIEMGGMFTTLKVRADLKPDDYSDPPWYPQPPGTQSFEYAGPAPAADRASAPAAEPAASVRKPTGHGAH